MPDNRFYIDTPLQSGQKVTLDPKESHHIAVMRKEVGDNIELINGKNLLAQAKILSIHKKKVELLIEKVTVGTKKKREFILCQALCELPRLDLILQKTTELGVHEIWLFVAERSHKKEFNAHQKERIEALLISAIKQCGRLDLPPLCIKDTLSTFEPLGAPAFFGDLQPNAPLFSSCLKDEKRLFFFIGPPSGFTKNEEKLLVELGACGVKLNDLILRTETASITAVSIGMHI